MIEYGRRLISREALKRIFDELTFNEILELTNDKWKSYLTTKLVNDKDFWEARVASKRAHDKQYDAGKIYQDFFFENLEQISNNIFINRVNDVTELLALGCNVPVEAWSTDWPAKVYVTETNPRGGVVFKHFSSHDSFSDFFCRLISRNNKSLITASLRALKTTDLFRTIKIVFPARDMFVNFLLNSNVDLEDKKIILANKWIINIGSNNFWGRIFEIILDKGNKSDSDFALLDALVEAHKSNFPLIEKFRGLVVAKQILLGSNLPEQEKSKLSQLNSQLMTISYRLVTSSLATTKAELSKTQQELADTKTNLGKTKEELDVTKAKLTETEDELAKARMKLGEQRDKSSLNTQKVLEGLHDSKPEHDKPSQQPSSDKEITKQTTTYP